VADRSRPAADVNRWLVNGGRGDPFDRHVFACVVAVALCEIESEPQRSLCDATGLDRADLVALFAAYFPHGLALLDGLPPVASPVEDAIEEPDLRQLLLDNRAHGVIEAEWLAAVVARRALGANHLWQDLGLNDRGELCRLLQRHFAPLAAANGRDMKWKKFFYRELCRRDGVLVCKAPNCEVCCDKAACFGDEAGEPLARMRRALS
jgi:nitrogen fixation protein NifQ